MWICADIDFKTCTEFQCSLAKFICPLLIHTPPKYLTVSLDHIVINTSYHKMNLLTMKSLQFAHSSKQINIKNKTKMCFRILFPTWLTCWIRTYNSSIDINTMCPLKSEQVFFPNPTPQIKHIYIMLKFLFVSLFHETLKSWQ